MSNCIETTAGQLREMLTEGVVKIVFEKKDGSRRELFGTLEPSRLPPIPEGSASKPKRKVDPDMVNVWSVADDGWRGFMIDQLLEEPVLIDAAEEGFEL